MDLVTFVNTNSSLLKIEKEAELLQLRQLKESNQLHLLCDAGLAVRKLLVKGTATKLYGRTVVTLGLQDGLARLPSHKLTPGDLAALCYPASFASASVVEGVVVRSSDTNVKLAVDTLPPDFDSNRVYCLIKLANDVTYSRLNKSANGTRLLQCILERGPEEGGAKGYPSPAVGRARPWSSRNRENYCRLRNCAAVAGYWRQDALMARSDSFQLILDMRKEMDKAVSDIRKTREKGARTKLKTELSQLRTELRHREKGLLRRLVANADIFAMTLTTCGTLDSLPSSFDVVVIDECAQALEVACWLALSRGKRCVLAGDHCQLPPTIMSDEAASNGLSITLMERLMSENPPWLKDSVIMLTTQYRMNQLIMQWSSDLLYSGELVADPQVQARKLSGIGGVSSTEETESVLTLIDTDGCEDMLELQCPAEVSRANPGEVKLVYLHVSRLVEAGLPQNSIAVISPYNLQIQLLRNCLQDHFPKVDIRSVDGFQGQEREAVIISLVRANDKGEVGFLAENRRLNVAVTRAQCHLCIVCHTPTVKRDKAIASLVHYISANGCVRSAFEYTEEFHKVPEIALPSSVELALPSQEPAQSLPRKKEASVPKGRVTEKPSKPVSSGSLTASVHPASETAATDAFREVTVSEIERFMKDDSRSELDFGVDLTSYQRKIVHELAEQLGLQHTSEGEAKDRHIVIRRSASMDHAGAGVQVHEPEMEGLDTSVAGSDPLIPVSGSDENGVNDAPTERKTILCPNCNHDVPKDSFQLHYARCGRLNSNANADNGKGASAQSKKKNKKKTHAKEEVDDDVVLEAFAHEHSRCAMQKCKQPIAMLGQRCKYCTLVHCLTHAQAEVHGCGDMAKREARSAAGSAKPAHVAEQKRKLLEGQMQKKLTNMKEQRAGRTRKK